MFDEIDGTLLFNNFCDTHNIGSMAYDNVSQEFRHKFTQHDLHFLRSYKMVVDGNKGGLVLGNLHRDGGVHVLRTYDSGNTFYYDCEMEGWEYLTSSYLTDNEMMQIHRLNDVHEGYDKKLLFEYDIPINCKIIDTRGIKIPIIIIDEYRRFIVNRLSTKNYLNEIMEIDNKYKI